MKNLKTVTILFLLINTVFYLGNSFGDTDPYENVNTTLPKASPPSDGSEIALPVTQTDTSPFYYPSSSIDGLVSVFTDGGYYNLPSPTYYLSDPQVAAAYAELQKTTPPHVISRDTTSWTEIQQAVKDHIAKYGDGALIILSGAAVHMLGAIPELEKKFGARYISVTPLKLSVDNVREESLSDNTDEGALGSIKVQMNRSLGVVKYLGYDNIEKFLKDRETVSGARNLIIGVEETGLHGMYNIIHSSGKNPKTPVYEVIKNFIDETQPTSILYIAEDLPTDACYVDLVQRSLGDSPDGDFIQYAADQGIPIEFGAFGWADNPQPQRIRYKDQPVSVLYDEDRPGITMHRHGNRYFFRVGNALQIMYKETNGYSSSPSYRQRLMSIAEYHEFKTAIEEAINADPANTELQQIFHEHFPQEPPDYLMEE